MKALALGIKPSLKRTIVSSGKCCEIQSVHSLSPGLLKVGYSCLLPPASCLLISVDKLASACISLYKRVHCPLGKTTKPQTSSCN